MTKIKKEQPEIFILVSFFSPSGMEHYHKRTNPSDFVCYLPLDTPGNAKRFIKQFEPKKAFFMKYEFWSNHIHEAHKKGTKIYNISGIFWKRHRFFKWYGWQFRRTLHEFEHFFVQNKSSADLLRKIGIKNVTISGDSRYDRVLENKKLADRDLKLDQFCKDKEVFIAGSVWPEDEKILMPYINEVSFKVIIAPHDISDEHLTNIEISLDRNFVRFTNYDKDKHKKCDVLILDTIGHLANAYQFGSFAYVGGGFSGSLHNILEPSAFGLPVMFGPKHAKFPEAQEFIEAEIGFSVSTYPQLKFRAKAIRSNKNLKMRVENYIQQKSGVTEIIYHSIFNSNSTI